MQAVVSPSVVSGNITAPASKSAMQRACAAALIKTGTTYLSNPGTSADDKAAIGIIENLGATIEVEGDKLKISSNGIHPKSDTIHCGESGLSVRMFTSIAALSEKEIIVNGAGSLLKRPMDFFNEVLPTLNVQCESNEGFLPLKIKGPVRPVNIEVDGSLSSQFLTGLLFAYSAADANDVTITVHNLNSKPYINLSLAVLTAFGLKTPVNKDYKEFYFHPQSITQFENDVIHYFVEGDWSGAAFLLVAGAIAGNISVKGLDIFSTQADKAILQALMQTGATMSIAEDEIKVSSILSGVGLKPFHFNATDCPDLFPPLVALASYCDGTSVIEGVDRLIHKESNRGLTLQEEFSKMGVEIQLQENIMLIKGRANVKATSVHSHHDHRIAMACAVAALKADGEVTIDFAEAVNKSYPDFWKHMKELNVNISLQG